MSARVPCRIVDKLIIDCLVQTQLGHARDDVVIEVVLAIHWISRTADNRGGKRTSSNGSDRGAPGKGESCALEEHCPGQLMVSRLDEGREEGWWRGSLEVRGAR